MLAPTTQALLPALALVLTISACTGAPRVEPRVEPRAAVVATDASAGFPVDISSCGHVSTLSAKPERVVTLSQGETEIVLALGGQHQLVGTAYLDDAVSPRWQAAYDKVPVLSPEYPTQEQLISVQPDLVLASYGSAFEAKGVGTRNELRQQGIESFVSPFGCLEKGQRAPASFENVWAEIDLVARALGVPGGAVRIREDQGRLLEQVSASGAGTDLTFFWYDSGTKTPYVGAGEGGPQLILDAVGGTNIFAGLPGSWAPGNWEAVLAADPDVIVVAEASWDRAEAKIAYLKSDPVLRKLRAVQGHRFVTIPFSESTPGVRLAEGARSVSDQLLAFDASE